MRNRISSLLIFLVGGSLFSLPAAAQIYIPGTPAQKEAAEKAKPPKYDPRDFSGIWRGVGGGLDKSWLLGGAPAPPMTKWAQELFNARKPSMPYADASRKTIPALGNDPLADCDPLGYPRNLGDPPGAGGQTFQFVQSPTELVQIFDGGHRIREIWTDGRKIPDDVDPRWYGYATAHWEGDSLIVDSTGYDERAWLDGNGMPHSEEMKLHEVFRHPDAMTLEVTMTIDDPKAYTKTWVGNKQTYRLTLPKESTVLYEYYCVPSEEEKFNQGVRNPAGGR
jgi:hypothetical protein